MLELTPLTLELTPLTSDPADLADSALTLNSLLTPA